MQKLQVVCFEGKRKENIQKKTSLCTEIKEWQNCESQNAAKPCEIERSCKKTGSEDVVCLPAGSSMPQTMMQPHRSPNTQLRQPMRQ